MFQEKKKKSGSVRTVVFQLGVKLPVGGGGPAGLRRTSAEKRTDVDACLYSAVIHKVESTTKLFTTV